MFYKLTMIRPLDLCRLMKFGYIILCSLISVGIFGQKMINPKVGINLSSYDGISDSLDLDFRHGFQIGMDFMIGDAFINFQPGIFYQSCDQGFEKIGANPFQQDYSIHSLKIPLNLALNLVKSKIFDLRFYGGPIGTYTFFVDENETGLALSDFSSLVLGADLGVGFDFSIITLDIVYELGLSDVFEMGEQKQIPYIQPGVKNNVLSLSLGIKF